MHGFTRRGLIRLLGAAGAATALGPLVFPGKAFPKAGGRVVVVGGGFGGAICANYLPRYAPGTGVTLVEQSAKFVTCPFSNTVLGGIHDMDFITHSYDKLRGKQGIDVVHDTVIAIDPAAKTVALKGGKSLAYDHLVVSPGISFRWGAIEGYDEAAAEVMPHAWKAGPQTVLLRKQLEAMKDGGVVVITVPEKPYRAPPAPYERASMIAYYLMENKPKSKVLILDSNSDFEVRGVFMEAWEKFYPGMIEWIKGPDGRVERVDAGAMTVHAAGQAHKGDVINVIPPQKAGEIAQAAGLADDSGWCPVDQRTFESSKHKGIHVIGDSCIAGEMPKGGSAANTQAKVCAAAIASSLTGAAMPEPTYISAFYLLVKKRYGLSNVAVYRLTDGRIKKVSGGLSPEKARKKSRRKEAEFRDGWYAAITAEMFG